MLLTWKSMFALWQDEQTCFTAGTLSWCFCLFGLVYLFFCLHFKSESLPKMPTNSTYCSCQRNMSVPRTYERTLEHILVSSQQMYGEGVENWTWRTLHSWTKVLVHYTGSEATVREANQHTCRLNCYHHGSQILTKGTDPGRFVGVTVQITILHAVLKCSFCIVPKNTFKSFSI